MGGVGLETGGQARLVLWSVSLVGCGDLGLGSTPGA